VWSRRSCSRALSGNGRTQGKRQLLSVDNFRLTRLQIRVVEQAPTIGEVGAGIQVSPNVSRLLHRWGLGDDLEKVAVKPEGLVFRRCARHFLLSHDV
jgi:hypothetical protein